MKYPLVCVGADWLMLDLFFDFYFSSQTSIFYCRVAWSGGPDEIWLPNFKIKARLDIPLFGLCPVYPLSNKWGKENTKIWGCTF